MEAGYDVSVQFSSCETEVLFYRYMLIMEEAKQV